MIKKEYFFLSTGYTGGASRFIYDHINFLKKKNKKVILIDDNPHKTFSKISSRIIIKKLILIILMLNQLKNLKICY